MKSLLYSAGLSVDSLLLDLCIYSLHETFRITREEAIEKLSDSPSLRLHQHLLKDVDKMAQSVDDLVRSNRWETFLTMARQRYPRPGTHALPQSVDRSGTFVSPQPVASKCNPLGSVPTQASDINQHCSAEQENATLNSQSDNSADESTGALLDLLPCHAHGTRSHDSSEQETELAVNSS